MTSPATPGVIPAARARGVRVALYGRVACPDDPHTAIRRQLRAVSAALPTQARIIGYFADAGPCDGLPGSIRSTDTWHRDDHPVKGGLIEPLDRACRAHRDLDVIACSDIDRLSRQLAERLRIEDHLACPGIRVRTPDDPAITTLNTVPSAPRRQRRAASGRHADAELPALVGEIRILDGADGERLTLPQARVLWEVSQWWVQNNSKPGPEHAG